MLLSNKNKNFTWWIPKIPVPEKKHKRSFGDGLVDLLENISMHCYSKLIEPKRSFLERVIWFVVHMIALFVLIVFLQTAWYEFVAQQLATVLFDPLYPIENIPFPAVSICSNNRISNEAAITYAYTLMSKDSKKRNLEYYLPMIRTLGYLYNTFDSDFSDISLDFQNFLDTFDIDDGEVFFNSRKIMQDLTPSCEQLILQCSLGGSIVDCFSDTAFEVTLTQYGYCCTFNSRNTYSKRAFKDRFFGSELGLTVVLNSSTYDNFYTLFNIEGFLILVYEPFKFPDVTSGGVSERFVSSGMESFLSLTPKPIDSVELIRDYNPKGRNCLFKDEKPEEFFGQYSFNTCITRCRIRSIIILCNCLPFTMPIALLNRTTQTVHCTLQHMACLARYQFKWMNVITNRQDVDGLEREMEDALYCPECYPACTNTEYKIALMTLPLDRYITTASTLLNHVEGNISDMAVLRLYFAEPTAKLYRQIIDNAWFEIFSTVGGICGIVIGFSLISLCEVFYFLIKQTYMACKDAIHKDNTSKVDYKKDKLTIYP